MHIGNDPPAKLHLNPLERTVLQALAAGLGDGAPALTAQIATAAVVARSHSGVGFVTRLQVPEGGERLSDAATRRIRPVRAEHPELREPAEFLVQVRDGRIASIEAFCHEGMWPADDARFRVAGSAV